MTTVRPLDDLLSQSDIQGKKVFLRADLNVPVTPQGTIRDATRLDRLLPTIQELSDVGEQVVEKKGMVVLCGGPRASPLRSGRRPGPNKLSENLRFASAPSG